MPRNMSFSMTTPQFIARQKTVTRRLGWSNLKIGDVVQGVEKAMGLKKGETIKKLGLIRVIDVRREPLERMEKEDCAREGYPDFTVAQFIEKFCAANKCSSGALVTRIEFEYIGCGNVGEGI